MKDIDTTIPHPGRVYDFVLGGQLNFEADRQAAQQILAIFPMYPAWARINRWFLQLIAERWAEEGRPRLLDLGSGLPTQGHFHEVMPDTQILYTDMDPLAVAYGREILAGLERRSYEQVNLCDPDTLIREASRVFGRERDIAVGFIGVSYFLEDDAFAKVARALHQWCAPGSVMAISAIWRAPNLSAEEDAYIDALTARFKASKLTIHFRDPKRIAELVAPWKIEICKPVQEWLGTNAPPGFGAVQETSVGMWGILLSHAGT